MKNSYKAALFILIGSFTFLSGFAQTDSVLSLDKAIALSLANSHQLKISLAKIAEANADLREAKNRQLPDFKITGSYLRLAEANVDLKMKTGENGGGTGGGFTSPAISQAVYGIANLSLPIFAGGRIRYGIESSRYLADAALLDTDNDRSSVILNTVQAYVNLFKAFESVQLVRENLQSSQSRDTTFRNLERNGLMARNDLLKSELQTSNVQLTLLDAENNLSIAKINMNLLLGRAEDAPLNLDTTFFAIAHTVESFDSYYSKAFENRKDLQALDYRKKAAAMGTKAARGELFPSIALTGGYIAADIPGLLTITNAMNVGVGVQYNLANIWKKNTTIEKSKARETELAETGAMLNDQIKLEINKSYQNYLLSTKKISVVEQSVAQAKENFRITQNKYNNGLETLTNLLEADVSLLQANLNERFAKADAVLSYYQLLQTAGILSK